MKRRVLLIGATGAFGSRLAFLLSRVPTIQLVLAARGGDALERLCADLASAGAVADLSVRVIDRNDAAAITQLSPWLVIDAAGPFQGSDYSVALTAAGAGSHYIDLADARDFVGGFKDAVDAAAKAAGTLAVTGASSTPALTHAALAPMVEGWCRLDEVYAVIAPGARAPRGLSVVQAILSYAGRPVRVFDGGRWRRSRGWSGLRRFEMPGLGFRLASLCETPDLDLLPARFPVRERALFMAGLELPVLHLGLALLSLPVRWGWLGSLRPLASPLRVIAGLLAPLGSDRGGMMVEAAGLDPQGRPIRARWWLCAEANAGPNTPVAPAAAVIRRLLQDDSVPTGAMACVGLVERDAILGEIAHLPITTRSQEASPADPALFRRLLGRAADALPKPVGTVHVRGEHATFFGSAIARSGRNSFASIARTLTRTPRSGRYDITVEIAPDGHGETWTRRFGESQFSSRLMSTGRLGIFEERFGIVRFAFDLVTSARGVTWRLVGWSLGRVPLPKRFAPRIRAASEAAGDRYRFRVVVAHPWVGLLFAYRGVLNV